jgi:hypothetical protein
MKDPVVSQAQSLGFACKFTESRGWKILPKHPSETWSLFQVEARWLLSVRGIPQIYLPPSDTLTFLKYRHRILKKRPTILE